MSKIRDYAESQVKHMIEQLGPKEFVTALHNASVHGDVFRYAGFEGAMFRDKDDELLKEWYKGIDQLAKIAKRIETE